MTTEMTKATLVGFRIRVNIGSSEQLEKDCMTFEDARDFLSEDNRFKRKTETFELLKVEGQEELFVQDGFGNGSFGHFQSIGREKHWWSCTNCTATRFMEKPDDGRLICLECRYSSGEIFPPNNGIDLEKAMEIAQIYRKYPVVQAVEIFGSVARDGVGHDLDLILITREEISDDFIRMVAEQQENEVHHTRLRGYFGSALTRSELAELILNRSVPVGDNPHEEAVTEAGDVGIDIFIFPPNWRDKLAELQTGMVHSDPQFMEKIVKDARKIA